MNLMRLLNLMAFVDVLVENGSQLADDIPWYLKEVKLFGFINVSMSFIVILCLLFVLAIVGLIAKGFIQEMRRPKK
ncbi:MAG: hypothetical protein FWH40_05320 [Coriobacteriia bacterium]|nr:hypothetical protein [Coriobacteriia bacterium]